MKSFFLSILVVLITSGCASVEEDRSPQAVLNNMENDYLQQINELGITELYKETKWRLYCNHCDVVVKDCMGREMTGITYGMLDMKVFFLKYENGKGELAYTFIYNDSLQCSLADVTGNKIHGIGFAKDGKEPLYYISAGSTKQISTNCDNETDLSDCPTRMINTDQPVIKKYLLANREKLNPWFHMEAIKRGVLED